MSFDVAQFNWVDYLIIAVIGLSVLISLVRGFVREAVSLIIWLAAILLALHYAQTLSDSMSKYIASNNVRYIAAWIIICVLALVVGVFINAFISTLVSKTGMGAFDRLIGLVFGAARGVLLVGVVLLFVGQGSVADSKAMHASNLTPVFSPISSWLVQFMPQQVSEFHKWLGTNKQTVTMSDHSNNF